ncbi:universal stress protein [Parapedobacter defluvii]|uniref:universal stress protein n=1 Tax=Parapedobacter defluvii TaxID=2045106 RepID=UPI00333E5A50
MESLLVPIDFSDNSLDAAQYALDWLGQLNTNRVILYHSNAAENTSGETLSKALENIRKRLSKKMGAEVICMVNNEILADGIAALVRQYQVSRIVMGITGRSKAGQKLIGSNVFRVSQRADVPVLIVPAKTRFKKIENIVLALPVISDLKNHIPHEEIKIFARMLDAKLMIVNVGRNKDKTPKPALYAGLGDIFGMFDELAPSYHFLTARNTANSVAGFARDNNAQLLVSIAGTHGFLEGMFKSSVTKRLAYDSTVPLLIYRASLTPGSSASKVQ